jgi:predicted NUDIX family phosphoesterase/thymidylate kinase
MKTELQIRAEDAAERFRGARKPVIFEFAGLPKAGKTSTANALQAFLTRCGFRVEIVSERISPCPVRDQARSNFNSWAAGRVAPLSAVCTTLAQILEKTQNPPGFDGPDILIVDQGLFDALCWLRLMEHLERIRPEERKMIESFLRMADWRRHISAVFVMTASPEDAMQRDKGLLPVERQEGAIINKKVLARMLNTTRKTAQSLKNEFRIFEIDTSAERRGGARQTAEAVANLALNVIEEHLGEDVLSLPEEDVLRTFAGRRCLNSSEAAALAGLFVKSGNFKPREEVEADKTRVQALPMVVVRDKSGRVLRLRRKERTGQNPLNERIVIWTGGPVRKEDAAGGDLILQCALREIQEELSLGLEPHELKLRGAVCSGRGGEDTQKRVAIVYEWKAKNDDAAIALSGGEFFDGRGTVLSGTFVPLKNLARDVDDGKIAEEWSVEIVRELLARDYKFSPRLF